MTGFKLAIVPTEQGPVGLHCVEAPEVWFEDQITVTNPEGGTLIIQPLDPVWLETVASGSLRVLAVVGDRPCLFGATIDGGAVRITLAPPPGLPPAQQLQVRLAGVRRRAEGLRFPRFQVTEAEANLDFWQAWRATTA